MRLVIAALLGSQVTAVKLRSPYDKEMESALTLLSDHNPDVFPEDHQKPVVTKAEPNEQELAEQEHKKVLEQSERALAEATDYFEGQKYDEAEEVEAKQLSHMYEAGYDGDGNAVANQKEVVDKHLSNLHEADKIWMGERAMVQLDSQISTMKKHKKHTAKSLHKKRHHHQEQPVPEAAEEEAETPTPEDEEAEAVAKSEQAKKEVLPAAESTPETPVAAPESKNPAMQTEDDNEPDVEDNEDVPDEEEDEEDATEEMDQSEEPAEEAKPVEDPSEFEPSCKETNVKPQPSQEKLQCDPNAKLVQKHSHAKKAHRRSKHHHH